MKGCGQLINKYIPNDVFELKALSFTKPQSMTARIIYIKG